MGFLGGQKKAQEPRKTATTTKVEETGAPEWEAGKKSHRLKDSASAVLKGTEPLQIAEETAWPFASILETRITAPWVVPAATRRGTTAWGVAAWSDRSAGLTAAEIEDGT